MFICYPILKIEEQVKRRHFKLSNDVSHLNIALFVAKILPFKELIYLINLHISVAKQQLYLSQLGNGLIDFFETDIFGNLRASTFKCTTFQVLSYLF